MLGRNEASRVVCAGLATSLLAGLGPLTGCAAPEVDITQDKGGWCIYSAEPIYHGTASQRFEAGDALWVTVESPCMSSNCDFLHNGHCSVDRTGDVFRIESEFVVEHAGDRSCAHDCVIEVVACAYEPLTAGELTIVHGDSQRTLTVPGIVTQNCLGTVY